METDISTMNPTFIFVDGSYYCFYRYFALLQWWKNAYPDEPLDDPYQNEKFVEKFRKTFVDNLEQIPKKLKIHKEHVKPILIVGKDCKREHIWRNDIFNHYKANRVNGPEDGFMGGPFFKMAYEEELFQKGGAKAILKHPRLEADDCIALSVKYLTKKYRDGKYHPLKRFVRIISFIMCFEFIPNVITYVAWNINCEDCSKRFTNCVVFLSVSPQYTF